MWAAGLFEGEGCFTTSIRNDPRYRNGHRVVKASLVMTDEDPVRRFHRAVGLGGVYEYQTQRGRPCWCWATQSREGVQAVVAMLWDGLGIRRRARAKEVLRLGWNIGF